MGSNDVEVPAVLGDDGGAWASFSDDVMCLSGASETEPGPGALLRGGFFFGGAINGPLAVIGTVAPTRSQDIFGFRCAR